MAGGFIGGVNSDRIREEYEISESEEFFSIKHQWLLKTAIWYGILSWIALVGFIPGAGSQLMPYQNSTSAYYQMNVWAYLKNNLYPLTFFEIGPKVGDVNKQTPTLGKWVSVFQSESFGTCSAFYQPMEWSIPWLINQKK